MLLVDDIDNREFLRTLLEAMYDELPAPKKLRKRYSRTILLLRWMHHFQQKEYIGTVDTRRLSIIL